MITQIQMLDKISGMTDLYDKIIILPHIEADGDALGSSLALGLALSSAGKAVKIILEEDMPSLYSFLPGTDMIIKYDGRDENAGLAIALDTGDKMRLGRRLAIFEKAEATVNIDHHTTNTRFAEHNLVCTDCAATGEIIFDLLEHLKFEIDKTVAEALYVAVATDTGGFRYSNTTSHTHNIAAKLIDKGLDVSEISKIIFDTESLEKVLLKGEAIRSLQLLDGGKIAVTVLDAAAVGAITKREEDTEGLVNIGRNIAGVEVSVVFKAALSGKIKVNLRSNSYVDVSAIAAHFSGGGHIRAAGCVMEGDMETVKEQVIKKIREQI